MKKINKTTLICIFLVIVVLIGVYFVFYSETKEVNEIILDNTSEENIENSETIENNIEEKGNLGKIVVYITGEVNKPGVYEVDEESRVTNVIEIAGGLTANADIDDINLAYKIKDETKINIPKKGEKIKENNATKQYISTGSNNIEENNNTSTQKNNSKININKATQSELETLPGIGPSTALKIIEYREKEGKYTSIEDIKKVRGIGDAKYEQIKDLITV